MPLTEQQIRHLEGRLREERARVLRALGLAVTEQSTEDDQERAGDLSLVPTHMADLGTDTFDDEVETANADRMSRELEEIDAALDRLYRHPERFGLAEDTGRPIPFERLDLVPWARTSGQAGV
jgi:RNA polymerase-binding transcription factor